MKRITIILFLAILFVASAFAQEVILQKNLQTTEQKKTELKIQTDLNQRINFARNLMKDRNFSGAAAYLENLYETNPDNEVIMNLLRQCYGQLQQYGKIEEILSRFMNLYPENISYKLAYAQILTRQSKQKEALEQYQNALTALDLNNKVYVEMVIQNMVSDGFQKEALEAIDSWRENLKDSSLFSILRGQIFESQKDYMSAIKEYYPGLFDSTTLGVKAENKVRDLLEFEDSKKTVEEYLLDQKDLNYNFRAVKLLTRYYINEKQLDHAFDFTIVQDSLAGFPGMPLLSFMNNCLNDKYYDEVVKMGDYIFDDYPSLKNINNARFVYAQALTRTGQYQKAIDIYQEAYDVFPSHRAKADALYEIGNIYLNYLGQTSDALIYFDSVVTHHKVGTSYLNAVISKPYCLMQSGEIDKAYQAFGDILQKSSHDDIKEEALFNMGLIKLFEKEPDSTEAHFNKLLVDYPDGYFVNDVLQHLTILDDAKESPKLLYDYSNAVKFQTTHKPDSAIVYLKLIIEDENKILSDFGIYKIYEIELEKKDTSSAIIYIDKLITEYPDSYYMPFGLKTKADIMKAENNKEEAAEIYRRLLTDFPNYPFESEVRKILRGIEENPDSA